MNTLKLLSLLIFCLATLALTSCYVDNNTETATISTSRYKTVIFSDHNLEVTIKTSIGKELEEDISVSELTKLKVLLASNKDISDLSGIEYCINLVELDLSGNTIVDISPLISLTTLEILKLNNNNIVNISAIAELTNLKLLNIQNNDISDIWPLVYNTGLDEGDRVLIAGNGIFIVEHTGPWDVVSELEDRGVKLHTGYSW